MTPRTSNGVKLALRLAFGGALVAAILWKVPLAAMAGALCAARWPGVAVSCLLLLAAQYAGAWRFHLLTRRLGFGFSAFDLFRLNAAVSFYRLGLPGGVGGSLMRWYKLARDEGRLTDALNVMLYDRLAHALGALGLGLALLLADSLRQPHPARWAAAGVIAAAAASQIGLRLALFGGRWSAGAVARLGPLLGPVWRQRFARAVQRADELGRLPPALAAGVWAWSLAAALLNAASFFALGEAVGLGVGFMTLGWARAVVFALNLLPITVAGLGVREGALLLLLQPCGVASSRALAFSLLSFLTTLVVAAAGAVFELHGALSGARRATRAA